MIPTIFRLVQVNTKNFLFLQALQLDTTIHLT